MEVFSNLLLSGACGVLVANGFESLINKVVFGGLVSANTYILFTHMEPVHTAMLACGAVASYFIVMASAEVNTPAPLAPLPQDACFYSLADLMAHVGRCRQLGQTMNLEFIPAYSTYYYDVNTLHICRVVNACPSRTRMADHLRLRNVIPGCLLGLTRRQETYLNITRSPVTAPVSPPAEAPTLLNKLVPDP